MNEKELILQGIDLLIEETEYAIENGNSKGLRKYREIKLVDLKTLKKKIIKGGFVIPN